MFEGLLVRWAPVPRSRFFHARKAQDAGSFDCRAFEHLEVSIKRYRSELVTLLSRRRFLPVELNLSRVDYSFTGEDHIGCH